MKNKKDENVLESIKRSNLHKSPYFPIVLLIIIILVYLVLSNWVINNTYPTFQQQWFRFNFHEYPKCVHFEDLHIVFSAEESKLHVSTSFYKFNCTTEKDGIIVFSVTNLTKPVILKLNESIQYNSTQNLSKGEYRINISLDSFEESDTYKIWIDFYLSKDFFRVYDFTASSTSEAKLDSIIFRCKKGFFGQVCTENAFDVLEGTVEKDWKADSEYEKRYFLLNTRRFVLNVFPQKRAIVLSSKIIDGIFLAIIGAFFFEFMFRRRFKK